MNNAIYNMILDDSGFKPNVKKELLKPVHGASWYNFVVCDKWFRDGKWYTMQEALKIVENENK
jgi:hypothetical protein